MKHIKTALWLLILSLIYATGLLRLFNISAELLLCFCGAYAFFIKKLKSTVVVSLICSALMSGLGGRDFVYSTLSCVYFALVCLAYTPKRRPIFRISVLVFIMFLLFEGGFYVVFCYEVLKLSDALVKIILPSALYNTAVFVALYFVIKQSLAEKERYIFRERL